MMGLLPGLARRAYQTQKMFTIGSNLQPGCLADQLLTGLPATNKWSQWGVTFSQVVWLIGC